MIHRVSFLRSLCCESSCNVWIDSYLASQLRIQFEEVVELKSTWATAFVPESSYDAHLSIIRQSASNLPLTWVPVVASSVGTTSSSKLDAPFANEVDIDCSQMEQDPSAWPSAEEVCLNDLYEEQLGPEVPVAKGRVIPPLLCTLIWKVQASSSDSPYLPIRILSNLPSIF